MAVYVVICCRGITLLWHVVGLPTTYIVHISFHPHVWALCSGLVFVFLCCFFYSQWPYWLKWLRNSLRSTSASPTWGTVPQDVLKLLISDVTPFLTTPLSRSSRLHLRRFVACLVHMLADAVMCGLLASQAIITLSSIHISVGLSLSLLFSYDRL